MKNPKYKLGSNVYIVENDYGLQSSSIIKGVVYQIVNRYDEFDKGHYFYYTIKGDIDLITRLKLEEDVYVDFKDAVEQSYNMSERNIENEI